MADELRFPFPYVAPVDPNIGRRVDHYFVLRRLLGKGGMGAAYLAEHEARAHIKCVIKLVLAEIARHPMIISRYNTEVEALSLLKHDSIVKLHGFGVLEDGQLFLRFEYVEGKSLDRYIADHGGRLPLRKAANFIFQLCAALQYAHDLGVIHRDLKPDNVMVEVSSPGSHLKERLKILDFGIAKVVASAVDATGSGVTMGTVKFMAPEQVVNAAAATGYADVFSLGQILYLMLTGTLPWGIPENDIMIYHKQRTEAPAWPPVDLVPHAVAKVIHRALSLVPEDRPTMHEFAIELACAIEAERGTESGTEILAKVVPDWVASSPHDAQTLPRPVATPEGALVEPLRAADGPERGREAVLPLNVVAPAPVENLRAHARPRALATPAAPVPSAASPPAGDVLDAPATPPVTPPLAAFAAAAAAQYRPQRPPTPVLAALPTGLASQQFAAQEPPVEAREAPIAVASEIELAAGTPGPRPYAHAELPAVLVSRTQLSGMSSRSAAPEEGSSAHAEPAPFVVPGMSQAVHPTARSRRRKLVLLGAVVCVTAAVAILAVVRLGFPSKQSAMSDVAAQADREGSAQALDPTRPALGRSRSTSPVAPAVPDARPTGDAPEIGPRPSAPLEAHRAITTEPRPKTSTEAAPGRIKDGSTAPPSRPEPSRGGASPADQPTAAPATRAKTAVEEGPSRPAQPRDADQPAQRSPPAPVAAVKRTGELAVLVRPWALIWLNGKPLNQTPYRETIPVGRYYLRIKNDDLGKDESIVVTVSPDKTTVIERKW